MSVRRALWVLTVAFALPPALARADTVNPDVRRLLDKPANRAKVVGLTRLGYAREVAERIIALKGPYFVDAMLNPEQSARYQPVTVYRGINRPARQYRPTYKGDDTRDNSSLRSGALWVTRDLKQAIGFTEYPLTQGNRRPGIVLELQLPQSQRIFTTGDALKLSRSEHLPDDRIYLRRVGFSYIKRGTREVDESRAPRWISVERAVKLGVVPRITLEQTAATFE